MRNPGFRIFFPLLGAFLQLSACGGNDNGSQSDKSVDRPLTITLTASETEILEGSSGSAVAVGNGADGSKLKYHWKQLAGAPVEFDHDDSAEFLFTAPQVTTLGEAELRFEASVVDGNGKKAAATIDFRLIDRWDHPQCDVISGSRFAAFSRDGGDTFVYPEEGLPTNENSAGGIVPLAQKNSMLLAHGNGAIATFEISTDAGCSWSEVGTAPIGRPMLASSGGDVVYAWGFFENTIYRVDANASDASERVKAFSVDFYSDPGLQLLAVSAENNNRLLAQDRVSRFHLSEDGGATWTAVGVSPNPGSYPYLADASGDLSHIVIGDRRNGAWVSYDMGANWSQASITSDTYNGSEINIFQAKFTENENVVWALGLNMDEVADSGSTRGRYIYRSDDGGLTFQPAVSTEPENERWITNATFFAPLGDSDTRLLFTYFACDVPDETDYFNPGRTYLYFYDDVSGEITVYTHKDLEGVGSHWVAPNDPALIYVGMNSNERC